MRSPHLNISLRVVMAGLVGLIAIMAGGSLWVLRSTQGRLAHLEASESVVQRGRSIVAHLASHPIVRTSMVDNQDWSQLSRQLDALHTLEDGLQYVSISKDGVTVFHEQTGELRAGEVTLDPVFAEMQKDVRMTKRMLSVGNDLIPVVVFAAQWKGSDGTVGQIEIALRKDTLAREEDAVVQTIAMMFRASMATVVVAFAICVLLIVWLMKRDAQREEQRRTQEHFAFAGVLANGIAHDFRNPMSSLRLDVQMLEKEVEKGEAGDSTRMVELSKRAKATVDRMDRVFNEFLFMSRPPSGDVDRVDVTRSVRNCMLVLEPRLEQANIDIRVNCHEGPICVLADEAPLSRAILNIMTNAVQFSEAGDSICVSVRQDNDYAEIEIEDSGPGIEDGEKEHIFEMFVSGRPDGTGLGLFLAKAAVENCGGSIVAANTAGGGARFTMRIPLAGGAEHIK